MCRLQIRARVYSLIIVALLLAVAAPALAGNSNPKVIPPHADAFGKSYEEWSAAWWQWAFSVEADPDNAGHPHPLFDTTGADCDEGQKGKVWFLGGIIAVDAEDSHGVVRRCTIPNGKAIFFPIFNSETDNVDGDSNPDNGVSQTELEDRCDYLVGNPRQLLVTIDGETLKKPQSYAIEPYPFRYDVTASPSIYDLFGVPWPGELDSEGAISCGYYVMLAPLAKGKHTIFIAATNRANSDFGDFDFDMTYVLTVTK